MAKSKSVYYKGLGDLYVKATKEDSPSATIDTAETVTNWAAIATGGVAVSQVHLLEGNYSLKITVAANGDGAELTPDGSSADYSANEDTLYLANIYCTTTQTITVKVEETTNNATWTYACVAGWNRVLIDLSSTPASSSGTINWSAIDTIGLISATSTDDFWLDGMYFFDTMADVAGDENIRLACVNEIGLDTSDDSVELKCSRNEVVETELVSTEISITATVKDFDPTGLALLGGGSVTTDSVTKMIEAESFTVASATYTLAEAATLKTGDGYGIWVYKSDTGELLQETSDSTIVPAGYYYVNPSTGVITFNTAEEGITMLVNYNITTTSGRTFEAKTARTFLEFALQFMVKGSNSKEGLLFFPRVKSSSFSIAPELEDFWSWEFEGAVLADTTSGNYYEVHVAE